MNLVIKSLDLMHLFDYFGLHNFSFWLSSKDSLYGPPLLDFCCHTVQCMPMQSLYAETH